MLTVSIFFVRLLQRNYKLRLLFGLTGTYGFIDEKNSQIKTTVLKLDNSCG